MVSIHALTKSATDFDPNFYKKMEGFQSTHSRRVRPAVHGSSMNSTFVSIHALTKSATFCLYILFLDKSVSIHALTKSATVITYRI